MSNRWLMAALFGLVLAGCGRESEPPAASNTPAVAEEAAAMKDAQERRERFVGDGKAKYTPQEVGGF
ncbi:hypothetical protein [Pusillimonas noertemannii]|uniref:Lipoprotein n=1 Tax=Pusillimonas noertemannii TaxID=305977 RepID=A0A2U1CM85_9BURK|nr:hypothetical protein [Pusillimonas noertemannii]NYT68876.1 hypothetical protein [Pusillimonas noertemannii]PVY62103.1 hypothetical protein C7440_1593 [Pusillimonas noertemannii]TFL10902.1 hypothetical protein CSC72_10385 [Pusillimonas noertemannii]